MPVEAKIGCCHVLKLELQEVVSHCMGAGNKIDSSGQRVSALKRLNPGDNNF